MVYISYILSILKTDLIRHTFFGYSDSGISAGKQSLSRAKASKLPAVGEGTNLMKKEESNVGSVGFGVYMRYVKNIGFNFATLAILFVIVNQVVSVYSNIWLSNWAAHPETNAPNIRDYYLGVYGAFGVAQAIAVFTSSILLGFGCLYASGILHKNLLHQIMRLPMAFFDTTPLGRIMNRLSKDVDVVDNLLPQTVRFWLRMLCNVRLFLYHFSLI